MGERLHYVRQNFPLGHHQQQQQQMCKRASSIFSVERAVTNRNVVALEWKEAAYSVRWEEFVAHSASVTCLALGRKSGRVLVTGGEDKKVNLWTIGKPHCVMSLTGHTSAVESVRFGQHEDLLCAGAASGAIKVWDLQAAKIIRTLTGHKNNAKCLDFHPHGDFIASGSADNSIKLWDIRRKGCIFTYKGHVKQVNSLKFSPDGRWIASAGEEKIVKLWDLAAGKLLCDFRGHSSSVTDVEFHPNEFLLASGSSDGTVKFWDLENYQMVSTSEVESGPIMCILFNSDGQCLFSGSQDLLKVYGWEPARTYDTLVMGWGKVFDITSCQNQLIAGAFYSTNVSVYVVDLKRVNPFGSLPDQRNMTYIAQSSVHEKKHHYDFNSPPNFKSETEKSDEDCEETFQLNGTYMISAPSSPLKSHYLNDGAPKFLPPLDVAENLQKKGTEQKSTDLEANLGSALIVQPLNITYTKNHDIILGAITSTSAITLPDSSKPIEKFSVIKHSPIAVSTGQPSVPMIAKKDLEKSVLFPQLKRRNIDYLDLIPEQRERPAGIDLDDFLPQYLQESSRLGIQPHTEMSDAEVMSSIFRGHESMITVLNHRRKNLLIIISLWHKKGVKTAMEAAVHLKDFAVLIDVLSIVTLKPSAWTLDMCQVLLPVIFDLLNSKYEVYASVGCQCLKLILKNFAPLIKTNILAPKGIGVDISREERYKKCVSCFNQLYSIRSSLLKRQSLQGKLGHSFRELHHLLQALE